MLLKLAIRNLRRNVRRTLAVILTVAMGTGSLFVFHGFNAGIMNQYRDNTIRARYGHGQINREGYLDRVYERPWEHWIEDYQELNQSLLALPGVKQVFPRVGFFGLLTNGRVTVSGRGQGIDGPEENRFFNTMNFEQGENLSDEPDGLILGKGLAGALDVAIGDRITVLVNSVDGQLNSAPLRVVGVFHTGAKEFDDVVFRIPLAQAQRLLNTGNVEAVALGLRSVEDFDQVESMLEQRFPELEATPFAVLDKVYYQHSVDWLDAQFGVIQLIILTIVVLGIFNTVSTAVLERKQEIGNLRANGESRLDVIRLLAMEGLTLGCLGAAAGIVLVILINSTLLADGILMPPAPGITRQFFVRIELQHLMAVQTFLLGAGTAILATVLASFRIVRMKIAEALSSA